MCVSTAVLAAGVSGAGKVFSAINGTFFSPRVCFEKGLRNNED